jgi:Tfp pilus assembly protein FimT
LVTKVTPKIANYRLGQAFFRVQTRLPRRCATRARGKPSFRGEEQEEQEVNVSTKSWSGVTLTELCVVSSMILILTGLSLPSLHRILDNARLKASAGQLASFYEQSRIRATQDDTYYEVLLTAPGVTPSQICLDLNGDGLCGANEPQLQISFTVAAASDGSVPSPLDASSLGFAPMSTSNSTMYNQHDQLVPGLAWNGRGLPCQRVSSTSPCGAVSGWVQYLKLTRSATDETYAAVAVGPTGRIKVWTYSNAGTNRNWF